MNLKTIGAEIWDFTKKNFLIVAGLVCFFYWQSCGSGSSKGTTTKSDTVTVQQPQPIIIMPPYTPQQAGATIYVPTPTSYQPITPGTTVQELTAQVIAQNEKLEKLAQQYYAIRNYSDSFQLKDTNGRRVGVVQLNQKVSENILKETQPTYQLSFPHTTITNTVYPKPKNQVFLGIGLETLLNQPQINQVQLGLMLKNKKDVIVGLAGTYNIPNKSPGFEISIYKKLSVKIPDLNPLN